LAELTEFETQLRNQILKNWKNYRKKRIDLASARGKEQFDIAGKYICVENVSSPDAAATIRINEEENDELVLVDGLEIETLFKHFFITNAAQADEWIDLIIGADFRYKKKIEVKSLELVSRGDAASLDFTSGDFTKDNDWHEKSFAGKMPAAAKWILIEVIASSETPNAMFMMRQKGNVLEWNVGYLVAPTAGIKQGRGIWLPVEADGIVEYWAQNVIWYQLNLIVKAWFI